MSSMNVVAGQIGTPRVIGNKPMAGTGGKSTYKPVLSYVLRTKKIYDMILANHRKFAFGSDFVGSPYDRSGN